MVNRLLEKLLRRGRELSCRSIALVTGLASGLALLACDGQTKPDETGQGGGQSALPTPDSTPSSAPSAASSAWFEEVRKRIATGEYAIRPLAGAKRARHEAVNRAQGLRAAWEAGTFFVSPREEASDKRASSVSLRAVAFGRPGAERKLPRNDFALGECRSDKAVDERGDCLRRLERHLGNLVEWWENRTGGIEQGFVVSAPPKGQSRRRLGIDVEVAGARVRVAASGTEAFLQGQGKDGKELRYAGLFAWDADGKTLPARMRRRGERVIRLEVDDSEAKYPIVIDPVVSATADWTTETDQNSGGIDAVVAGAGDVNGDGLADVLVGWPRYDIGGPPNDDGRVLLYYGRSTGPSTTADWTRDGSNGELLGRSVASAGDVNGDGFSDIIIGASTFTNDQTQEGRALVFHGSSTGIAMGATPNWEVEGNQASAFFGRAVAGIGDANGDGFGDVAVGASGWDGDLLNEGRVSIFHGSAGGLSTTAARNIEGDLAAAQFGLRVSGAGDVNGDGFADLLVGTSAWSNGQFAEGAAFLFLGSASGIAATPTWMEEGNEVAAEFGVSVSSAGDVNGDGYADVVVGARLRSNPEQSEGMVHVYHGGPGGLTAAGTLELNIPQTLFGSSVSSAGDVNGDGYGDVIVGALGYDGARNNQGAAYLFLGSPTGLLATPAWSTEGGQADAQLGDWVAGLGDVNGDGFDDVIVSAPRFDNDQTDEGRFQIFLGSADTNGLLRPAVWTTTGGGANRNFGAVVAQVGDVNGDGFADIAVSAPDYFGPGDGAVFVYHGAANGPTTTPSWPTGSPASMGAIGFGQSIAGGDANGDGFSDLVVGAPGHNSNEGRLFLISGSASGLEANSANWWAFSNGVAASELGRAVAVGDVNGDGLADVIAGAPGVGTNLGRIYLFVGSATGLAAAPTPWTADGGAAGGRLGVAVAVGDLNGDGFGDIAAGAPLANGGNGSVSVFFGAADGAGTTPTSLAGTTGSNFGAALASAGDINRDGLSELLVGAPKHDVGGATGQAGRAFLYRGTAGGTGVSLVPWTAEGDEAGAGFGTAVAGAGDLNGDGFADLVVGAPLKDGGGANSGRLYVFLGGAGGPAAVTALTIDGEAAGDELGSSVAGVGDVNGDGYSDVVVGAPKHATSAGRALLFFGNSQGRALRLRAQRPASSTPVAPGGLVVNSNNAFQVTMAGIAPIGRSRVRMEVEVKPLGSPFNGADTLLTAWTDTGLAGIGLTQPVSGLTGRTAYHYRARLHYDLVQAPRSLKSRWVYGAPLGNARGVHVRTDGKVQGSTCTADAECASNFCVDGVCCNSACGGNSPNDCQVCSATAGASADGVCTPRPNGVQCNDGTACTQNDTCQAGVCVGASPVVCQPLTACHNAGTCDPATGLCSNPVKFEGSPCEDGNACTSGETCQSGVCQGGTPVVCMPTDPCQEGGMCDATTGMCVFASKPDGTACDDGSVCTQMDVCQQGRCVGMMTVTCPAPMSQCHEAGVCDPVAGTCGPSLPKADGAPCDDGDMCTVMDVCMAGMCMRGTQRNCDDGNPCTMDSCSSATGCVHMPIAGCIPPPDAGVDAGGDAAADGAVSDGGGADGAADVGAPGDGAPQDSGPSPVPDGSADGTRPITPGDGGTQPGDGAVGSSDGTPEGQGKVGGGGGCSCEVGHRADGIGGYGLLLGAGLLLVFRRRRRR
jgi:hypothetical protein